MKKAPKRPRDLNQLAKTIADIATGDKENDVVKTDEEIAEEQGKDSAAVALGRKGGLKGGKARAQKLSKEQLSEIGKAGAKARWAKHKHSS